MIVSHSPIDSENNKENNWLEICLTKLQRNYSCDIKMSVSLTNILTHFLLIFIYSSQEHEFIADFLKENDLEIYTSLRHNVPCEISALFSLSINFCLNLFFF